MTNKLNNKFRFIILKHPRYYRSTWFRKSFIMHGVLGLSLCLLSQLLVQSCLADSKKSVDRELWKGTMSQTAPMSWSGPFELFLRYDSENPPPQPLDGLTIWPTLGQAKIKIHGTWKSDSDFEFEESKCVSGDCSEVIVGGKYKAALDSKRQTMSGTATGPMGLKGDFKATRFHPTQD